MVACPTLLAESITWKLTRSWRNTARLPRKRGISSGVHARATEDAHDRRRVRRCRCQYPLGARRALVRRARYRDIAKQRSPYYDGQMMSGAAGASAAVFTGSPGMLRCTLGVDARVNADAEAANAGGEVEEDG